MCNISAGQNAPSSNETAASPLLNQDDPQEKQILALRERVTTAVAEKNVEVLLEHLHADFVLTAQDGLKLRVIRKHAGIREYFERLFSGDEATLKSVRANIVVEEIQRPQAGEVALANGNSDDHYVMRSGGEYDLKTRWSATLIMDQGQWKLINLHVSSDAFDNPIFNAAKSSLIRVGSIGLMIGLVAGLILTKVLTRRAA